MDKEIISEKQGIFIMSMFIIGSFIILGTGSEAKQDIWIAIILGLLMSFPMLVIYSKLLTLYPDKNLYDIIIEIFGNIAGRIISLLFMWYSFHLGALVMRNFSEFVNIISFPETPQSLIIILMGLLCVWIVKAGIEVLGRWVAFVFPIVLTIITLTVALSMTNVNFINLKPVLYNGFKPVLHSGFAIFVFPFAETVIFTMVLNSLKNKKSTAKVFFISVLIGSVVMTIISVRNILVLGTSLTSDFYFPSYLAVRTLNIGNFLQRFEIVVAIVFILSGFIKISICLYTSSIGAARILNIKNYRHVAAPIGLLMMYLASILYKNSMDMFDWASKIYPYYAIPFQVILPVIILIAAKIKLKGKKVKYEH